MPKIYSRYKPPLRPGILFTEPTRTQQHFKNETDINQIVKRAIATGNQAIFTPTQRAQFYDCTAYQDFQSALDMLGDVEDDFSSLPSAVRKQFGNDVERYVAFMSDPRNIDKAIELGLLEGGEKSPAPAGASGPSSPAGAPSETSKTPVLEPPAAAEKPAGHSSS